MSFKPMGIAYHIGPNEPEGLVAIRLANIVRRNFKTIVRLRGESDDGSVVVELVVKDGADDDGNSQTKNR